MEKDNRKPPRKYMLMAIEAMKNSIPEKRDDHPSPKVGAVLVFPDGKVNVAFRGELREGDHAEYTVLDKKNRRKDLSGCWLFATLEPCAAGSRNAPKIPCSERIANARISKVWFGEEDLALSDDKGGIKFLEDKKITVEPFDPDLVKEIKRINKEFGAWALAKRNKSIEEEAASPSLLYQLATNADLDNLSDKALQEFLDKSKLELKLNTPEFYRELLDIDLLRRSGNGNKIVPTNNAILLFGKSPRNKFPQSSVKAKVLYGKGETDVESFDDAIVLIPYKVEAWAKKVIPESFDRNTFTREKVPHFPPSVIREAIINAIVHRDYTNDGTKIQIEVTPDKIVVKSPGLPVSPNTLEKLQNFTAISYSRNKKIALIFNKMRLMEEAAVGMDTYRDMRAKYNLPLPIITYEEPNLVVTFPRTSNAVRDIINNEAISQLNDEELAGYDFVKSHKEVSRKEYEDYFGFERKKASNQLKKMKELGLINDNGKPSTSHDYRYIYIDSD